MLIYSIVYIILGYVVSDWFVIVRFFLLCFELFFLSFYSIGGCILKGSGFGFCVRGCFVDVVVIMGFFIFNGDGLFFFLCWWKFFFGFFDNFGGLLGVVWVFLFWCWGLWGWLGLSLRGSKM